MVTSLGVNELAGVLAAGGKGFSARGSDKEETFGWVPNWQCPMRVSQYSASMPQRSLMFRKDGPAE